MEVRKIAENSFKPLICKVFTYVKTGLETHREPRGKLWTTWRRDARVRLVHTLSAARPQAPVGNWCDPPDVHRFTPPPEHGPSGPGRTYPQRRCERYRASRSCAAGKRKMLRVACACSTKGGVSASASTRRHGRGWRQAGPGAAFARTRQRIPWRSSPAPMCHLRAPLTQLFAPASGAPQGSRRAPRGSCRGTELCSQDSRPHEGSPGRPRKEQSGCPCTLAEPARGILGSSRGRAICVRGSLR